MAPQDLPPTRVRDALADAREMGLPAAAVANLGRRVGFGLEDAEVLAMRLVNEMRAAGWTITPPAPPL